MFTGIIEAVSEITRIEKSGSECRLCVKNPFGKEIKTGDSIAVDGVCLTVETFSGENISFFVSKATLEKTTAGSYNAGTAINLERAMPAGGRFDGHIVQGHVDSCGKVSEIRKIGDGTEIKITFDKNFEDLTVPRGSIAVNGVSLTIAELAGNTFKISLIPETMKRTSFGKVLKTGTAVNLEFDVLGKYVAKIMHRSGNDEALENLIEKL